jgi:hypothetical protein
MKHIKIYEKFNMQQKILVRSFYQDSEEILAMTIEDILELINDEESHSDGWIDYDESDWLEGWIEWIEGEYYSLLDKHGKPLNNLIGIVNLSYLNNYQKYTKNKDELDAIIDYNL